MSGVLKLSEALLSDASNYQQNFVIPGLSRGEYGFIIGAPGSGKGYLSLSLSYELAGNIDLVDICSNAQPMKVLYWPAEEKKLNVLKRINKHLSHFDEVIRKTIFDNFSLYDVYEPICAPINMFNSPAFDLSSRNREALIEAAKEVDLLIIDTLREAVGACKEVEHDLEIKLALQEIAAKADCAVLVTHHPTKDLVKKKEAITSVSGSGLSLTQATSRYALFLEQGKTKDISLLSHSKHNNVEQHHLKSSARLHWTEDSLIHSSEFYVASYQANQEIKVAKEQSLIINEEELSIAKASEDNPIKASEIDLGSMEIPEEELKKSEERKAASSYISSDEKAQYEAFLKKQKKKK